MSIYTQQEETLELLISKMSITLYIYMYTALIGICSTHIKQSVDQH